VSYFLVWRESSQHECEGPRTLGPFPDLEAAVVKWLARPSVADWVVCWEGPDGVRRAVDSPVLAEAVAAASRIDFHQRAVEVSQKLLRRLHTPPDVDDDGG
jgi:hypothetical protein